MTRTLNPNAPECKPVPLGIYPYQDVPLPFSFSPPSSTVFHNLLPQQSSPAPPCFPSQVVTYMPPTLFSPSQPLRALYHSYSNFQFTVTPPRNKNATSPPPSFTGPRSHPGRGCWRRVGGGGGRVRGFQGERGGGGGVERCQSAGGGNRRRSEPKFERRGVSETRNNENDRRKGEFRDRHRVTPLTRGHDQDKTTVMIKNIPYNIPREQLMNLLDGFCNSENAKARDECEDDGGYDVSAYDFLYLPIDFKTKKSRGFAFVNFTNPTAVWKFVDAFHLKQWDFVEWSKWPKKIEIVCAKIQGKEALANHFSNTIFECDTSDFLPVFFKPPRDGSGDPCQLTVVGNRWAICHHENRRQS